MTGQIVVERGSLYDLLDLLGRNIGAGRAPAISSALDAIRYLGRRVSQFNPRGRSERNVAHPYDIDASVYDLFLDGDRQYSCAYFPEPGIDLDTAQEAKKRHIASKLQLAPGQRILDIGSGWGGLGLYLAQVAAGEVTGITLSREQLNIARDRAYRLGLSRTVRFEFEDYRNLTGSFDRIVSVGMFEHVGINHYAAFFRKVADLLAEDGVALIHAIGRSDGPAATNAFIAKHIFPGGYIPALSEVLPAIERSGLMVTDIEILRLHYAETLRRWRERFLANRDKAVALRGEAFARMWEFYLAGSEIGFRYQNLMVFQIQLTKSVDALPITRDYMLENERRLASAHPPQIEPRRSA
jgi:cyclopropane-fatty-acyl-phospholipid synthase